MIGNCESMNYDWIMKLELWIININSITEAYEFNNWTNYVIEKFGSTKINKKIIKYLLSWKYWKIRRSIDLWISNKSIDGQYYKIAINDVNGYYFENYSPYHRFNIFDRRKEFSYSGTTYR
jgi:hypothetical protein